MNEGCATFVHYEIVQRLHRAGRIDDGAMLEILHNHANVLTQPGFDDPRYGGLNPYALGFAMMRDIQRVCREPDEEDRAWFPDIAGCGDWRGVLRDAWANYRDESFVRQFLSPKVMREMRLFALEDEAEAPHYAVTAIHDERGYRELREALAATCEPAEAVPDIQVVDVDLQGDRTLRLAHFTRDGRPLDPATREATLAHLRHLWGYDVTLEDRRAG
jgi:spore cortex formation protein SpoVR/YcgB (stage V sporulation)